MPALSVETISGLLAPYLEGSGSDAGPNPGPNPGPGQLWAQLSVYLDLLLKWNARTNLTAIREPEEIVRRDSWIVGGRPASADLKVDRSKRLPSWVQAHPDLRFTKWSDVGFYPDGYKGTTTEALFLTRTKR